MSGSLDRNRIMKLFETLSARLAARRIRGQLYIVGGSAMIVGYGRERTTRDVDARIEYANARRRECVSKIVDERVRNRRRANRPPKSRTLTSVPALRFEPDSWWILRSAASEI